MSVKIMAALYEKRLGSPQMKAVALKLADCANNKGRSIYPSKCTIVQQTELDRATVFRCVAKLLDMGLLVIDRKSKGEPRRTRQFTLLIWLCWRRFPVPRKNPSRIATRRSLRPLPAVAQSDPPVAQCDLTRRSLRPKPSMNHQ